jgi:glycosyltransferase involved in cell wall biosynthesis
VHSAFLTLNSTSEKIESELGIPFKSRNDYDLIIANHNTTVNYLFGQGPIIQICHGTLPPLEQPSPLAFRHIAVSEETAAHLRVKGFDAEVILNGIDTRIFQPQQTLNDPPEKLLSLCQSEAANELLKKACESEGISFQSINKFVNPTFHIAAEINRADIVVGLGRSVYDAMACGRPCIIFDERSYNGNLGDGYLDPADFDNYVRYNCSGRYLRKSFSEKNLREEIKKYKPLDGARLRQITLKKLNMDENAKRILHLGLQIPYREKLIHQLKTVAIYYKYKSIFKEQKRLFKERIRGAYREGKTKKSLMDMVHGEKFPFHIRLSLYLFIFKLS